MKVEGVNSSYVKLNNNIDFKKPQLHETKHIKQKVLENFESQGAIEKQEYRKKWYICILIGVLV